MKYVITLESSEYGRHFLVRLLDALRGVQVVNIEGERPTAWDLLTAEDLLYGLRVWGFDLEKANIGKLMSVLETCRTGSGGKHTVTRELEAQYPEKGYCACSTALESALFAAEQRT